jgi:speckle-type POZ protein
MFTADFKEVKEGKGTIKDVSKEAFQEFLNFIYTGKSEQLQEYVVELLGLAHLYELKNLKNLCEAEMFKELNESNAHAIFQYTHLYNCQMQLKQVSFQIIQK